MAITSSVGLNSDVDGILGLGAEADSAPSFMVNLRAAGKIDATIISVDMGWYKESNSSSSIEFGGYDESKFEGNLVWFPLKSNNWWSLDVRQFSYGNESIAKFSFYDNNIAVIDTGSSLLGLPDPYYKAILSSMSNKMK